MERTHYTFKYTYTQLMHAHDLVRVWNCRFYCILYDDQYDHYYAISEVDSTQATILYML